MVTQLTKATLELDAATFATVMQGLAALQVASQAAQSIITDQVKAQAKAAEHPVTHIGAE